MIWRRNLSRDQNEDSTVLWVCRWVVQPEIRGGTSGRWAQIRDESTSLATGTLHKPLVPAVMNLDHSPSGAVITRQVARGSVGETSNIRRLGPKGTGYPRANGFSLNSVDFK